MNNQGKNEAYISRTVLTFANSIFRLNAASSGLWNSFTTSDNSWWNDKKDIYLKWLPCCFNFYQDEGNGI